MSATSMPAMRAVVDVLESEGVDTAIADSLPNLTLTGQVPVAAARGSGNVDVRK
jgi:glyoxylate carboligase